MPPSAPTDGSPARSGPSPAPALYFVNAPVDCAVIGGASVVAWALMALVGTGAEFPIVLAFLSRVCNWPHFAASTYRLYHDRENVRQYPLTALLAPVVVIAGMVAAFASPALVAPVYVKLMLIWSPYHFSGQTLGIALVYARRAGFALERTERRLLSAFVYATFAWTVAHAETGAGVRTFLGVVHPKLGLPPWVGNALALALVVTGTTFLVLVRDRCRREGRRLPPVVLLPPATQLVWFVLGSSVAGFQALVPFFHSLQYLFIAWAVQLREKMARNAVTPSALYVAVETSRWWMVNVILGIVLFAVAPWLCTFAGQDLLLAMALVSSAVQLHHFFVDGVIWKLRSPRVSSPLLVNLDQLLRPPAPALGRPA